MKSKETAALALSLLALRAMADTYPRQLGIKVVQYKFEIALNDSNDEFDVRNTVEVQFLSAGVGTVDLDLCQFRAEPRSPQASSGVPDPCAEPVARAASGRGAAIPAPTGGKGMNVTAVTAGRQALTFRHENDRLRVTLPRMFQPGEHFEFTVNYHGVPATGILVGKNKYGDREYFSNPWPHKTRNYLAVIDHPYAKAPVMTSVTAPRRYQVISNGRLVEQSDLPGDLRRTVWNETSPICPCLMSMGVAPFAVSYFGEYHNIPLSAWVYPQERDISFRNFAAYTQPILEFYIDHIGPYSYEKLAQVEANGIGGGMELASSIYYGYGETGPGRQLVAHEMAHQWFGDSAAEKDWDDVWLSEGFATYFALLYQEFQDGHDAFLDAIRRSKEQAIAYALANPDSTIVHRNLPDFSKVIANRVQIYQGGAQALQNIRGVLGTDVFWTGIRLYYSRFQNANASTDDFRRAMEQACAAAGDRCPADGRDLTWLFHELLNRGGVLQIEGNWHYDVRAKELSVDLTQTQTSGLYRMPIELGIITMATAQEDGSGGGRGGSGARTQPSPQIQVIRLEQQHQTFNFPMQSEPVSVALDPNAWVMMQVKFDKR